MTGGRDYDVAFHRGRRGLLRATIGLGVGALLPATVLAQLVEVVPRIKPSVLAVGTFQRTRNPSFAFRGTGFAIGNGRLIATNAHVLPAVLDEARMETLAIAVPGPRGGTAAVRPATLAARDEGRDLALLRIEGEPIPALPLDGEALVREGQDIAFTGFPIGNALGFAAVTHRGIIAAITPIGIPQDRARELNPALIRRLGTDPFDVYQLDATAYPGNSGSPVFDPQNGRVIGIVNMVFVKSTKENVLSDPSGISYAIPVRHLREMLARL
ncbi:MAG TPA: serine protease [Azoarcus taiwanensis]|nr:serine protease [Azoarcus taiwanensis]